MTTRRWILAAILALPVAGLTASPAQADHYGSFFTGRFVRGRDGAEIRRREILRARMADLVERIQLADRHGVISRREAYELLDDLDDVRDFLRDDHYLTDSEFDRRMCDLDDVQRHLGRCGGVGMSRFPGRFGNRYYRDDRGYFDRGYRPGMGLGGWDSSAGRDSRYGGPDRRYDGRYDSRYDGRGDTRYDNRNDGRGDTRYDRRDARPDSRMDRDTRTGRPDRDGRIDRDERVDRGTRR